MTKLRVHSFSISVDGFGAAPGQDIDNPFGVGGLVVNEWRYPTRTFRQRTGNADGETGTDDDFEQRGWENIGAWIIGRNMFSPLRGPWRDDSWKGWWGDNPPYHTPVYVLTHHFRPTLPMEGDTVFHFVDDIQAALEQARTAANGKDIRLGGGVTLIRQYLQAGLIDEMHFAISPAFLGSGEHLLTGIDLPKLGYGIKEYVPSARATHVVIAR